MAGLGQDVGPGGPAAPTLAGDAGSRSWMALLVDQRVEVAADGGGGQAEQPAERGGGDRAVLRDRLAHAVAGARLQTVRGTVLGRRGATSGDKHHISVT